MKVSNDTSPKCNRKLLLMSELDYATPNVHVMGILWATPSEARMDLHVLEETTGKILGVGENQTDLERLYPLPVRVRQLFMQNSPNCHGRHTFGCSTRMEIPSFASQYTSFHTNRSCILRIL
jgi:hypothetical protein